MKQGLSKSETHRQKVPQKQYPDLLTCNHNIDLHRFQGSNTAKISSAREAEIIGKNIISILNTPPKQNISHKLRVCSFQQLCIQFISVHKLLFLPHITIPFVYIQFSSDRLD